jgi:hypothetical protein
MSVLNENQLLGASGAGGDYEIEQSLRFNDDDGSYLSWTPASAGNRKTWTWSGWVKRGNLLNSALFSRHVSGSDTFVFRLDQNYNLQVENYTSSAYQLHLVTDAEFRDSSAWYHILLAVDTAQATASDRAKIYVNGVQQTSFSSTTYPALNASLKVNESSTSHNIGMRASDWYFDGYLGEVNFIDGQALTPDSFGETGDYGEWKPIAYAGGYGTNGFYLPFKQDYTVEGFSTVTYEGTGATQYIGGTGFQPDLVWGKRRDSTEYHVLNDSVRGFPANLYSNVTNAEDTNGPYLSGVSTDGFSVGSSSVLNASGGTFVAWNWDMGGTTASNTSGSITSSVRANTTYGQSIVSYSGTGSAATVGHGLASTPTMIIVKNRSVVNPWWVYTATLGAGKQLRLNETTAEGSDGGVIWNNTAPTSSVFSVNSNTGSNGSGNSLIAYCFHDVANYSKFGSYSGNGSTTGPVVTLGFTPAFVLVKKTSGAEGWYLADTTRSPTNPSQATLSPDSSNAENTSAGGAIDFLATGFQPRATAGQFNDSGATYIYAAFADTREYAYWLDQSGNNNDWTSNGGLTESDVMVDSPTNNFCTWNPLNLPAAAVLSEGNTKASQTSNDRAATGTMAISSGKYYFEIYYTTARLPEIGLSPINQSYANAGATTNTGNFQFITNSGGLRTPAWTATSTTGLSAQTGTSVIGFAVDADAGKAWFTNASGTYFNSGNPATGANPQATFDSDWLTQTGGGIVPFAGMYSGTASDVRINCGQDSSFAGAKTPQGNQDGNDIGDFFYAPPSGFLSLCSANLPSVDVIPSEHFQTRLITGTGASNTQVITGFPFAPDFVWIKNRSSAYNHAVYDTVRGASNRLYSNLTNAEASNAALSAFSSEGYTVGTDAANENNVVSWNWKAGGSASSNTNGSITSSVSANPSAGFSIVSYTGTSAASATIGHSLSQKPELIMVKKRDEVGNWIVFTETTGKDNKLNLNETTASATSALFNNVAPTSTVFSVKDTSTDDTFGVGHTYIAYAFHSVDGYSKVGSYTGNGSADGPFVNLGFKPALIIVKNASTTGSWRMYDRSRSGYNPNNNTLYAEGSYSEDATVGRIDLLSNGFKIRIAGTNNASGVTVTFLAFAETPFKFSNAR